MMLWRKAGVEIQNGMHSLLHGIASSPLYINKYNIYIYICLIGNYTHAQWDLVLDS